MLSIGISDWPANSLAFEPAQQADRVGDRAGS
jgi:hypothetical protein